MEYNTIFLRLEGPFQAWGNNESKFVVRKTYRAPTKSGIIGLLGAAMGISRMDANEWLPKLRQIRVGVRIDRPGFRWWDYHTVGAKIGSLKAEGGIKINQKTKQIEAFVTRREFLCDASFLVAIISTPDLIELFHRALQQPKWQLYLGRKCCVPSMPVYNGRRGNYDNLISALVSIEWNPRYASDIIPESIEYLIDWDPTESEPIAPDTAEIWYDVPVSFLWPSHHPRYVIPGEIALVKQGSNLDLTSNVAHRVLIGEPLFKKPPSPQRPRADYTNSQYKAKRTERLMKDNYLCVFCKSPATTVQHITYRNAGGNESIEQLRSLCRLCHDAVTMIEYGENMGLDRINPEEELWRDKILKFREDIIKYRSMQMRERLLTKEINE